MVTELKTFVQEQTGTYKGKKSFLPISYGSGSLTLLPT